MGIFLRYLNLVLLIAAFSATLTNVSAAARESEEDILVGRISHVEGKLLRYIEEEKDWVVTVKDSPFGLEDALYAGDKAKAEFIMPNLTWLRAGENTQLQLVALNAEVTTVDVASGLARLYNKSDDVIIKVTTPFGYVVALGGAVFDLYVGDDSLEIIAVSGVVDFIHDGTSARYEVQEDFSSIIADEFTVARGNGTVDSDWDNWNGERDEVWAERLRRSEYSAGFLPEAIREEAHVFEENGQWERVYYENEYRDVWRPTRVESGWRPFTAGRWTVYYGDNCWIPDESFGYVTHHYGSWIYVESSRAWFWVPPAPRFVADAPGFSISFGWYPGRVGWIHSGSSIGWVPLAPNEVYYGYRPWGHRTVVVSHASTMSVNINIGRYRFLDEAVVVHREHFYRGSRYTPNVERNVGRDVIINNYRPTTVINTTVINNFNIDKRRFTYNDVEVNRKPHTTVTNRINDNRRTSRGLDQINRQRIERELTRVRVGSEPSPKAEVQQPMLATKLVTAENLVKPLNTLTLPKNQIKPKERERPVSIGHGQGLRSPEQGKSGQIPGSVKLEENGRSKFPKDSKNEEVQQLSRQQGLAPQAEENQGRQEKRTRRQQEETQGSQEQLLLSEKLQKSKLKEEGLQPAQVPAQVDNRQRLKSPKDKEKQEAGQVVPLQDQVKLPAENQSRQEQKLRRQPQGEERRKQDQDTLRRQQEEMQRSLEQLQQSERLMRGKQKEERPLSDQVPSRLEEKQRLRSPREKWNQDAEQTLPLQDRGRQPVENQSRQEQELQRQQQEGQQIRQTEEKQRQQQAEIQRQQEQEMQQRQQKEGQRRQEQELQRQQQEGQQIRQKEEKQRQQQAEVQRQQEQELQRQQQEGQQIRQKEEKQRQQQAEIQRQQEQEMQQRQQKEGQRRQEQELQRQQQEGQQIRQKQEKQRQQQEPAAKTQEQEQPFTKKKKQQQEEAVLQEIPSPLK